MIRLLVSCLRPRSPKPAHSPCACANKRPREKKVAQYHHLGRSLLPWTIIEVNEHIYTFETLFTSIQDGRFDAVKISEDLKRNCTTRVTLSPYASTVHRKMCSPAQNISHSVLTVKSRASFLLSAQRDPLDSRGPPLDVVAYGI